MDFSTFSYPGKIGKRIFSTSSYPGNIGSYDPYSVLSWKYWKLKSAIFSRILEILEICVFQLLISWKFWKTILFNFLTSWKYWIVRSIYQSHPGNSGSYDPYISPILEIVDRTIHIPLREAPLPSTLS